MIITNIYVYLSIYYIIIGESKPWLFYTRINRLYFKSWFSSYSCIARFTLCMFSLNIPVFLQFSLLRLLLLILVVLISLVINYDWCYQGRSFKINIYFEGVPQNHATPLMLRILCYIGFASCSSTYTIMCDKCTSLIQKYLYTE